MLPLHRLFRLQFSYRLSKVYGYVIFAVDILFAKIMLYGNGSVLTQKAIRFSFVWSEHILFILDSTNSDLNNVPASRRSLVSHEFNVKKAGK